MASSTMLVLGVNDAWADEGPPARDRWQVSASFQRGFEIKPDRNDPLGWAMAIDGGISLDSDVYLGARFEHFFGHHSTDGGLDQSFSLDYPAVVAGRDVPILHDWTLRPSVAIGAVFRHRDCAGDYCGSGFAPAETLASSLAIDLIYVFGPLLCGPRVRSDLYFFDNNTIPAVVVGAQVGAAW
jgi:hypothetical protein